MSLLEQSMWEHHSDRLQPVTTSVGVPCLRSLVPNSTGIIGAIGVVNNDPSLRNGRAETQSPESLSLAMGRSNVLNRLRRAPAQPD